MQDTTNLTPIESDVKCLINQDLFCFDSDISTVFKELKISNLLNRSKINKRCGHSVTQILFDLCVIPFLMFTNVFIFARNQFDESKIGKSTYYRFLENAKYNWSYFIFWLSVKVSSKMQTISGATNYFVLDDTIKEVTGKGVEGASYLYDHTQGKSILGFQKLVLGYFNGAHFVPIIQKFCAGKKKSKSNSKATKYAKKLKSEHVPSNSPGEKERKDLDKTKLEKGFSMLRRAKRQFKDVNIVLFDSWFCFNSFIIKIKEKLSLDVICQLKNLPGPNKYIFKNKVYSLAQLYAYHAKPRMRTVKKLNHKQAVVTVCLPNSKTLMKIVFILNDGQQKWHAFCSTDIKMSGKTILENYSQRWSIEVFFKNCKQYLNYGKEQASNLDTICCSDAIVFMRYLILTYISYKENTELYASIERNRTQIKFIEYGFRLLRYFMKRITFIIEIVMRMIEENQKENAINILKEFIKNTENLDNLMQFV